jgi:dGTPase
VSPAEIADRTHRESVAIVAASTYATDADEDELLEALSRLESLPYWPRSYHGSHAALASLKVMTSQLIGRFCTAAELATRERFGDGPLSRYSADLVIPREQYLEVAMLKAIAAAFMMRTPEAITRYTEQREVIAELVHRLSSHAEQVLDPLFLPAWQRAEDDARRLRVVIDAIASLTDPGALSLLARLRAL